MVGLQGDMPEAAEAAEQLGVVRREMVGVRAQVSRLARLPNSRYPKPLTSTDHPACGAHAGWHSAENSVGNGRSEMTSSAMAPIAAMNFWV